METIDVTKLSAEEKEKLLNQLSAEKANTEKERREAYESLKTDFTERLKKAVRQYIDYGKEFKLWLRKESESWYGIMKDYGKLKRGDDQMGFVLKDDDFKLMVKCNLVKKFDERADIAEKRLVDFLGEYVKKSEKGTKDPMYKMAMKMIARNESGDLDYKSISILYDLEEDFKAVGCPEYSEIMQLFRESNVIEGTAIHFYFEEKDKYNIWRKIEPSFNRM